MFNLSNKIALITGASGGIGQATARALHQLGATVILSGTNQEKLESLRSTFDGRAYCLACDLNQTEQAQQLIPEAETKFGPIDILVNNAGVTKDGLAMMMKDADWQQVLNLNLNVPFYLARATIKSLLKRKAPGRIINISSVVGFAGNPGQANYVAAKAGLVGMSKSLAQEVAGRNITVNNVAPGFIVTNMTDKLTPEQQEKIIKNIPLNRLGRSEDVAACVAFLASDEAAYLTGQTLHVNG